LKSAGSNRSASAGLRLALTIGCDRFDLRLAWETDAIAIGLFGASGAGKSSVLEALAGIRPGVRGRIEVGGRTWLDSVRGLDVAAEHRGVGYVPQELALFPHLDVLGNLRFGERRAARLERRPTPERILELLELAPLARRPVTALSGGERQRVALGRALLSGPELLLLDEPLASLDLALRRRILPYLLRVREELGIPTLYVSHEPSEMTLLCDEICILERGQKVASGPPAALFGAHRPGAGASGDGPVNLLQGVVQRVAESLAVVEVEPGLSIALADEGSILPGQRVAFEVRGSDILLARGPVAGLSAQNVLAARVTGLHSPAEGDPHAPVVVSTELGRGGSCLAVVVSRRAARELALAPGEPVHLIFKAQVCRLLAAYAAPPALSGNRSSDPRRSDNA
jgi:molybdate transport system ATP-binding protein